jgi:hypothetical protein
MELYAPGQIMNDPIYGQISYSSSLSNALELKLGFNVNRLLVKMKAATGKDNAEHVIRPATVIPAIHLPISYAHC